MRSLNDVEMRNFKNGSLKVIDHVDMTELQVYDICRDMIGSSFRCVIGGVQKCLPNIYTPINDKAAFLTNVESARAKFTKVVNEED